MTIRIGVALLLGFIPAVARADHHGMTMESHPGSASSFGAGLSLVAASYSTMDYIGDYQGVVPALSWSMGRISAGANIALYRLQENGREVYGQGDVVVHGQASLVERESVRGGVMLAVSAPTGDHLNGLGMGHVMAMPALWGTWKHERLMLAMSAGVSRALAGAMTHHDHGPWPLVEPMNTSELTWSASGEVAIARGMRAGARIGGGIPVIDAGHDRVVAALRVAMGSGSFDTAAELQTGLAGDPFTVRAVVETTMRF